MPTCRASARAASCLSGGPESVTDVRAAAGAPAVFELGVPVLGICYGMQTMAQQLGGRVTPRAIANSAMRRSP
jgi:GMP synthase (glutamine-hydrolysing)